jgi:hypothetical protein
VFQFIAVLEEKERYCGFLKKNGAAAILRTQQLSRNSSVIALSGLAFDHHANKTLLYLTPFCVDFVRKECTSITQES